MVSYSHSKISMFEQCRYKYKLQYIDKVKVETPTTVEAFMGDMVHRTLQKLYVDLSFDMLNTPEQLLAFYNNTWEREWSEDILIVKDYPVDNYRRMGERFILNYYNAHVPFDDMTVLETETEERLDLPDGNTYHVRIDKLGFLSDTYYVCDYKTNARMKMQEEADSDRQLAMYSLWVRTKFPDAKRVLLVWHMLAFGKDVQSERSPEQLEALQKEVVRKIKEIEACTEYPTHVTALCDYCVFKSICPSFKHEAELEEKSVEEFKEDDGVKLVNEYAHYTEQKREAEEKLEELKEKLVGFASQKSVDVVYGSNKRASVKPYIHVTYPEDKSRLLSLLKKKGIFEEYVMLNQMHLSSAILKGNVDREIANLTKQGKMWRVSVGRRE